MSGITENEINNIEKYIDETIEFKQQTLNGKKSPDDESNNYSSCDNHPSPTVVDKFIAEELPLLNTIHSPSLLVREEEESHFGGNSSHLDSGKRLTLGAEINRLQPTCMTTRLPPPYHKNQYLHYSFTHGDRAGRYRYKCNKVTDTAVQFTTDHLCPKIPRNKYPTTTLPYFPADAPADTTAHLWDFSYTTSASAQNAGTLVTGLPAITKVDKSCCHHPLFSTKHEPPETTIVLPNGGGGGIYSDKNGRKWLRRHGSLLSKEDCKALRQKACHLIKSTVLLGSLGACVPNSTTSTAYYYLNGGYSHYTNAALPTETTTQNGHGFYNHIAKFAIGRRACRKSLSFNHDGKYKESNVLTCYVPPGSGEMMPLPDDPLTDGSGIVLKDVDPKFPGTTHLHLKKLSNRRSQSMRHYKNTRIPPLLLERDELAARQIMAKFLRLRYQCDQRCNTAVQLRDSVATPVREDSLSGQFAHSNGVVDIELAKNVVFPTNDAESFCPAHGTPMIQTTSLTTATPEDDGRKTPKFDCGTTTQTFATDAAAQQTSFPLKKGHNLSSSSGYNITEIPRDRLPTSLPDKRSYGEPGSGYSKIFHANWYKSFAVHRIPATVTSSTTEHDSKGRPSSRPLYQVPYISNGATTRLITGTNPPPANDALLLDYDRNATFATLPRRRFTKHATVTMKNTDIGRGGLTTSSNGLHDNLAGPDSTTTDILNHPCGGDDDNFDTFSLCSGSSTDSLNEDYSNLGQDPSTADIVVPSNNTAKPSCKSPAPFLLFTLNKVVSPGSALKSTNELWSHMVITKFDTASDVRNEHSLVRLSLLPTQILSLLQTARFFQSTHPLHSGSPRRVTVTMGQAGEPHERTRAVKNLYYLGSSICRPCTRRVLGAAKSNDELMSYIDDDGDEEGGPIFLEDDGLDGGSVGDSFCPRMDKKDSNTTLSTRDVTSIFSDTVTASTPLGLAFHACPLTIIPSPSFVSTPRETRIGKESLPVYNHRLENDDESKAVAHDRGRSSALFLANNRFLRRSASIFKRKRKTGVPMIAPNLHPSPLITLRNIGMGGPNTHVSPKHSAPPGPQFNRSRPVDNKTAALVPSPLAAAFKSSPQLSTLGSANCTTHNTIETEESVFGLDLIDHFAKYGTALPAVIRDALSYIGDNVQGNTGIFRRAGSRNRVCALRKMMDDYHSRVINNSYGGYSARHLVLPPPFEEYQIHDVADVIKQFYRELSNGPLFTPQLTRSLTAIYEDNQMGDGVPDHVLLGKLNTWAMSIPSYTREALIPLLSLCHKIARQNANAVVVTDRENTVEIKVGSDTRMTTATPTAVMSPLNLAICLVPTLFSEHIFTELKLKAARWLGGDGGGRDCNSNSSFSPPLPLSLTTPLSLPHVEGFSTTTTAPASTPPFIYNQGLIGDYNEYTLENYAGVDVDRKRRGVGLGMLLGNKDDRPYPIHHNNNTTTYSSSILNFLTLAKSAIAHKSELIKRSISSVNVSTSPHSLQRLNNGRPERYAQSRRDYLARARRQSNYRNNDHSTSDSLNDVRYLYNFTTKDQPPIKLQGGAATTQSQKLSFLATTVTRSSPLGHVVARSPPPLDPRVKQSKIIDGHKAAVNALAFMIDKWDQIFMIPLSAVMYAQRALEMVNYQVYLLPYVNNTRQLWKITKNHAKLLIKHLEDHQAFTRISMTDSGTFEMANVDSDITASESSSMITGCRQDGEDGLRFGTPPPPLTLPPPSEFSFIRIYFKALLTQDQYNTHNRQSCTPLVLTNGHDHPDNYSSLPSVCESLQNVSSSGRNAATAAAPLIFMFKAITWINAIPTKIIALLNQQNDLLHISSKDAGASMDRDVPPPTFNEDCFKFFKPQIIHVRDPQHPNDLTTTCVKNYVISNRHRKWVSMCFSINPSSPILNSKKSCGDAKTAAPLNEGMGMAIYFSDFVLIPVKNDTMTPISNSDRLYEKGEEEDITPQSFFKTKTNQINSTKLIYFSVVDIKGRENDYFLNVYTKRIHAYLFSIKQYFEKYSS